MVKVSLVPGPSRDVRRFNRDEVSYTRIDEEERGWLIKQ